ncbi:LysR family transcriptional regulator [bacterium]|nr:MAG: LysR family transcriptional regulator [bacterium]
MQFRQIECFLAVAEELNFSRAARRLRLSQPPLSKNIQQLEAELGVQLFVRDHHSVALTAAGKVYRDYVQPIMQHLEQARLAAQRVQAGQTGELRIGFVSGLFYDFVPPLLLQYRKEYTDVRVNILEMVPSAQTEALIERHIDVAFPGLAPGRFGVGLSSRVIRKEPWYVCLHADHELASREKLDLAELRSEQFVFMESLMSPSIKDALVKLFEQAGYSPMVTQTTARAQSVLTLVAAGVGISVFSGSASHLPAAGLAFVPLTDNFPLYEHSMVWNPANVSPVLKSFLDYQSQFQANCPLESTPEAV